MLSLPRRGCSLLHKPMRRCVNPLGGEPLTGEPDAGNPPVRFGGRGSETNRLSLPLSGTTLSTVMLRQRLKYHAAEGGGIRVFTPWLQPGDAHGFSSAEPSEGFPADCGKEAVETAT